MNRDELLAACFPGRTEFRSGTKLVESTDGFGSVIVHADISFRRVIVEPATGRGEGASLAGDTLTVAAVANVCVDPAFRGQGWGRTLMEHVAAEAASHALVSFAALFADESCYRFFDRFGYEHPAGATDLRFRVCSLRGEAWPDGRVDTQGEW